MRSRVNEPILEFLINSKELKRIVLERCKELNINLYFLGKSLDINHRDISSWIYYHTSNHTLDNITIGINTIFTIVNCLGIFISVTFEKYIIIKLPMEFCTFDNFNTPTYERPTEEEEPA